LKKQLARKQPDAGSAISFDRGPGSEYIQSLRVLNRQISGGTMIKKLMILSALLALAGFAGCKKQEEGKTEAKKLVIAVIPKGTTHEFWKSITRERTRPGLSLMWM
jgi:hypothetical protein